MGGNQISTLKVPGDTETEMAKYEKYIEEYLVYYVNEAKNHMAFLEKQANLSETRVFKLNNIILDRVSWFENHKRILKAMFYRDIIKIKLKEASKILKRRQTDINIAYEFLEAAKKSFERKKEFDKKMLLFMETCL